MAPTPPTVRSAQTARSAQAARTAQASRSLPAPRSVRAARSDQAPRAAPAPVLIVGDDPADSSRAAELLPALRDAISSLGEPRPRWLPVRPPGHGAFSGDELRTSARGARAIVLVTTVRNNSYSGEVKLALDQLGGGPVRRKPVGLVSIGAGQSTHAVDHLRVVLAALDAVAIPHALLVSEGGAPIGPDATPLRRGVGRFIDELLWFAGRLHAEDRTDKTVRPEDTHSVAARIDSAVAFIRDNYTDNALTLDRAAGAAFMSRYHFSRTFKRQVGRRFVDFVTDLRMAEAHTLLLGTALPVAEICERVGYRDLSHFQRTFRTAFGTSPSACRLAAR